MVIDFFVSVKFQAKLSNVIWFQLLKCESPAFLSRLSDRKLESLDFGLLIDNRNNFWPFHPFIFPDVVSECVFSLVAPVQSDGDVSLDVSALVLRQVTRQQLPPQVDQLHHHVADLVEQIHLVFLTEGQTERETETKRVIRFTRSSW